MLKKRERRIFSEFNFQFHIWIKEDQEASLVLEYFVTILQKLIKNLDMSQSCRWRVLLNTPSTPGRCCSSQKGLLYGAAGESRVGIATLKWAGDPKSKIEKLLLSMIIMRSVFFKKLLMKFRYGSSFQPFTFQMEMKWLDVIYQILRSILLSNSSFFIENRQFIMWRFYTRNINLIRDYTRIVANDFSRVCLFKDRLLWI